MHPSVRLSVSLTSILQSPRLTMLVVYHFDGPLQYVIHFTTNLCWSKHCKIIAAKATKCLNYSWHTLWGATPQVKSIAFKCLVRPIMEYGYQLWNPFTQKDIQVLENIQCCAAHWVCGSRWNPFVFFLDQIVRSMFTPVGMAIFETTLCLSFS